MRVIDIGPRDAEIFICGDAPGVVEEQKRKPFEGPSGALLKDLLSHSGVSFKNCFVTNVVSERPPGNNFAYFYEDKQRKVPSKRLENDWQVLRDKIEHHKPRIVFLLGGEALRAVTNKRGIMTWRGFFQSYKGIRLMPTIHPTGIMREFNLHPIFEMDIVKGNTQEPAPWPEMLIKPSIGAVARACTEAMKSDIVSFDLETLGKNIRCLGLAYRCKGKTKSICIPFVKFPSSGHASIGSSKIVLAGSGLDGCNYWSPDHEVAVLSMLAKLFASGKRIVGQNSISFDQPLLESNFSMEIVNHFFDLMHAQHLLYCEIPKSLDFICSSLTCYPQYSAEKNTLIDDEEWTYNCQDTIVTLEASEILLAELEEANLSRFFFDRIMPLTKVLNQVQQNGVLIDETRRAKFKIEAEEQVKKAQEELNVAAKREVNPNSPKQMKELFYKDLLLPKQYGKSEALTTDENAIRKLIKMRPDCKVLHATIKYRKAQKLLSTYLGLKTSEDGRMRTSYNASGTKSGRLSSSKNLFGEGTNLQNIPAGKGQDMISLRPMFVAKPGHVILKGDLKQAETMVVAHILHRLGYHQMYSLYQSSSFDVHKWTATSCFNVSIDSVTKNQRNIAKIVNHSGNYMSGPRVMMATGLKYGVELSFAEAKRLLMAKRAQVEGLLDWWNWVKKELATCRTLHNCHGRRRLFFGRTDDSMTLRDAVSWEPQSTVGDLTNIILCRLNSMLPDYSRPILQVHDEVCIETPEDKVQETAEIFTKAADFPMLVSQNALTIPLELSFGPSWGEQQELLL